MSSVIPAATHPPSVMAAASNSPEAAQLARHHAGNTKEDWRPVPKALIWSVVCALLLGGAMGALLMQQRDSANAIVIAVNGKTIDQAGFTRRLERTGGKQVIRQMAQEELQIQFARSKGVAPSEDQVSAQYDKAASRPNFLQAIANAGQSPEDFRANLRLDLSKAALAKEGVTVSDEEVRRYYDHNIDKRNPMAAFYQPDTVQMAVIVTGNLVSARRAQTALKNGEPFDQVARAYSKAIARCGDSGFGEYGL
jgi:hypothetical protein